MRRDVWLETFPVGPLACNCTLVGDPVRRLAVAIDPGDEAEVIAGRLAAAGMTLVAQVHTHAHIDHIGATEALRRTHRAPAWLHALDLPLHAALGLQAAMLGLPPVEAGPIDRHLVDGMVLDVGDLRLEVVHTPGHSPGSVSFRLAEAELCFSGDTLFAGSVGRTDLPGGDGSALADSIRRRLFSLPGDTRVVPGHGPPTTIDRERRTNPYVGLRAR